MVGSLLGPERHLSVIRMSVFGALIAETANGTNVHTGQVISILIVPWVRATRLLSRTAKHKGRP